MTEKYGLHLKAVGEKSARPYHVRRVKDDIISLAHNSLPIQVPGLYTFAGEEESQQRSLTFTSPFPDDDSQEVNSFVPCYVELGLVQ